MNRFVIEELGYFKNKINDPRVFFFVTKSNSWVMYKESVFRVLHRTHTL